MSDSSVGQVIARAVNWGDENLFPYNSTDPDRPGLSGYVAQGADYLDYIDPLKKDSWRGNWGWLRGVAGLGLDAAGLLVVLRTKQINPFIGDLNNLNTFGTNNWSSQRWLYGLAGLAILFPTETLQGAARLAVPNKFDSFSMREHGSEMMNVEANNRWYGANWVSIANPSRQPSFTLDMGRNLTEFTDYADFAHILPPRLDSSLKVIVSRRSYELGGTPVGKDVSSEVRFQWHMVRKDLTPAVITADSYPRADEDVLDWVVPPLQRGHVFSGHPGWQFWRYGQDAVRCLVQWPALGMYEIDKSNEISKERLEDPDKMKEPVERPIKSMWVRAAEALGCVALWLPDATMNKLPNSITGGETWYNENRNFREQLYLNPNNVSSEAWTLGTSINADTDKFPWPAYHLPSSIFKVFYHLTRGREEFLPGQVQDFVTFAGGARFEMPLDIERMKKGDKPKPKTFSGKAWAELTTGTKNYGQPYSAFQSASTATDNYSGETRTFTQLWGAIPGFTPHPLTIWKGGVTSTIDLNPAIKWKPFGIDWNIALDAEASREEISDYRTRQSLTLGFTLADFLGVSFTGISNPFMYQDTRQNPDRHADETAARWVVRLTSNKAPWVYRSIGLGGINIGFLPDVVYMHENIDRHPNASRPVVEGKEGYGDYIGFNWTAHFGRLVSKTSVVGEGK